MGVVDGRAERPEDRQHFHGRHAPALGGQRSETLRQGGPVDVLHDHEVGVVDDIEVDDAHDVGMPKSGDRSCLGLEAGANGGVPSHVRVQHLDGHGLLQPGMRGLVHRGHAAPAHELGDRVAPQSATDHVLCRGARRDLVSAGVAEGRPRGDGMPARRALRHGGPQRRECKGKRSSALSRRHGTRRAGRRLALRSPTRDCCAWCLPVVCASSVPRVTVPAATAGRQRGSEGRGGAHRGFGLPLKAG
jgi:hypothetical protein